MRKVEITDDVVWEIDPVFQVDLWTRLDGGGWRSNSVGLSACDVIEALSWAKSAAAEQGARAVVWLRVSYSPEDGVGAVWLWGEDPTREGGDRAQLIARG